MSAVPFTHMLRRSLVLLALLATSCAPGTAGLVVTEAPDDVESLDQLGDEPIEISLPRVPAIALPELDGIDSYDDLLASRLVGLEVQPIDGVEVVTTECEQGSAVLEGDDTSGVFAVDALESGSFTFEIDEATGAATYWRDKDGIRTSVATNGDGSGTFVEESYGHHLSIEAERDGSGVYYRSAGDAVTSVSTDGTGAGTYVHRLDERHDTITIKGDGSGEYYSASPSRLLTIDAVASGVGDLYLELGERLVTLRVRTDNSWELIDTSPDGEIEVKVAADGSGNYRRRGDIGTVSLDFDADGRTFWRGQNGPPIVVPPVPKFVVADRFPPLGTLATIAPPCTETVLRFDSQVLFADNDATVLPEAAAILADVAPVLAEIGRPIEVAGHTDARGSDDYNRVLSEERAASVAAVLESLELDVAMRVVGYGESKPVAQNFLPDGTDDVEGQRLNRRVEIVLRDGGFDQ